ncbi:MAG: LysM peptidoglycan-binding domain-containing protein [Pseudomonadota bacterium]
MSLFFACFFSACQTLPTESESIAEVNAQSDISNAGAVIQTQAVQPPHEPVLASVSPDETPAEVQESLPSNVWERMRNNYKLIPSLHPKVASELRWYNSHPSYIERIQERARPYIHFILDELEKRDMPAEIALLPAVESAFQPFAYSPGRAAGIWQFIPSTGRGFGLKQNWWYDGRRDVVASTHAALDYLTQLNRQFDGDWELALAAYNSGGGTVRSAIRKNRKKGKPTNFWSLKLPKETRQYVPRLLAISEIFANPDTHNVSLLNISNEPYFETVDIQSQLDLALAAQMAELSIQELYQLNSGFNRWATDPDGPHRLHLPLDKSTGFKQKLAQLPEQKRVGWKRYKIRSGDSLSVIAQNHGTSSKLLKQINKLRNSKIRAGKHLLIPVSTKQLDHYAFSAKQRKAQIQNKPRKGSKQRYVVKKGDSLWEIAKAHHVNHRQLAKWNGMAPRDPIRPGQKLVLWVKKRGSTEKVSALDLQPSGIQNSVSYKVRRGDSLSRIAQRFSVSVNELKKWNALGKYLQPGQHLKLYVDVTEQTML